MIDLSNLQYVGKIQVEIVTISLLEFLDVTAGIVAPLAMAKSLQFELIIDPASDLPQTIKTDPMRLKQVLVTLLWSAIKATQIGKIELIISRPSGT